MLICLGAAAAALFLWLFSLAWMWQQAEKTGPTLALACASGRAGCPSARADRWRVTAANQALVWS